MRLTSRNCCQPDLKTQKMAGIQTVSAGCHNTVMVYWAKGAAFSEKRWQVVPWNFKIISWEVLQWARHGQPLIITVSYSQTQQQQQESSVGVCLLQIQLPQPRCLVHKMLSELFKGDLFHPWDIKDLQCPTNPYPLGKKVGNYSTISLLQGSHDLPTLKFNTYK